MRRCSMQRQLPYKQEAGGCARAMPRETKSKEGGCRLCARGSRGRADDAGGTTYCSVASLILLRQPICDPGSILRWTAQRQLGGFQGRPGKLEDVCYSFWIGATIQLLGGEMNHEANRQFLLSAQSPIGGFGKEPEDMPDPYHSYLALAALALAGPKGAVLDGMGSDGKHSLGLKRLDPLWNVSQDTAAWLKGEMKRIGR